MNVSRARQLVTAIYQAGIAAVHGEQCVARHLADRPPGGPVSVIALGKAASAMATGAVRALASQLQRGYLVTRDGHTDPDLNSDQRFTCVAAGHPVPDQRSLDAGAGLLRFIAATPAGETLLLLISGGTSSLVEVLKPGVSLDNLSGLNRWLLASGLDIGAMNQVRAAVSEIKAGGLDNALAGHQALVLLISDVPGVDPAVIGSGLLISPARDRHLPAGLPDWLEALLATAATQPSATLEPLQPIEHRVIATLDDALQAAARYAEAQGLAVTRIDNQLQGDAVAAGQQIATFLQQQAPGIYLWGGETTVCLPDQPGQGGRNQSLALAAAVELAGRDEIVLLAAGTDGSDGPGRYAGALVDGNTFARGSARLDAAEALRSADAGSFLDASGDLLTTGPTGTNVMDMVVAMKTA